MADVRDVAEYILKKRGPMSTWKLQKLVYYSQAWHLVWEDDPLFGDRIEAWANGPVIPNLYHLHQGRFKISTIGGNTKTLDKNERETIDVIVKHYGPRSPDYLSQLTHLEKPWRKARRSIPDGERSSSEITKESMADYYSSL